MNITLALGEKTRLVPLTDTFTRLGVMELGRAAFICLPPGGDNGWHSAEGDTLLTCLEGVALVNLPTTTVQLEAGESTLVPQGMERKVSSVEGARFIALVEKKA